MQNNYKKVGINTLLVQGAKKLLTEGDTRVNVRTNSEIKELRDHVMFGNPNMRYINIDERKNNLSAQIVEMMMVLSGNPDLKYLSLVLPRAIDYSDDDGKTWRGNYGIRIRGKYAFNGENNNSFQFARYTKDNLARVIEEFNEDSSTRQNFITIGDSNLDRFIKTKDTPCTMTLVFGITQDNLLTLTTFMRSNDIIFGFTGVNYFIFTCLQELVASILGYDLGYYCHHAVSFHVYQAKYGQLENISKLDDSKLTELAFSKGLFRGFTSLGEFDNLAAKYFEILESELSVHDFVSEIQPLCPNVNLMALLTMSFTYIHSLPMRDFKEYISESELLNSGLIERDSFFNKRVK